jgi:hypothetical protein
MKGASPALFFFAVLVVQTHSLAAWESRAEDLQLSPELKRLATQIPGRSQFEGVPGILPASKFLRQFINRPHFQTNPFPVITPPSILSPLQDQTVPFGGTVTFTVFPFGTGPLSYQWTFQGIIVGTDATLTLANVQMSQAGQYVVVVSNIAGSSAPGVATLTVTKASQTINFTNPGNKTLGDPPFPLSAASGSGLPVAFTVVSGPATLNSGTVTLTGAGGVTIRASQPGDGNYNAAPDIVQSFNVAKADQMINFPSPGSKSFGDPPFSLSADSGSGLPVTFSFVSGPATLQSNIVTLTGAGLVAIRASQSGDANYNAAPDVIANLQVGKANQTISFAPPGEKIFGAPPFTVSATASSGLPVTFSVIDGPATITGSTVTLTGTGLVTLRASQGGDANFNAGPPVDHPFLVLLNPTPSLELPMVRPDGAFQFTLSGVLGKAYVIEATLDFTTWSSLATNFVNAANKWVFVDLDYVVLAKRFYRARLGQ